MPMFFFDNFKKGSIYTIKLMRRGLDITGGFDQNILKTLMVGEFS
jgi:chloride channel protein, CIC family